MRSDGNIIPSAAAEPVAPPPPSEIAAFRRSAESPANRIAFDSGGGEIIRAGAPRPWGQRRAAD